MSDAAKWTDAARGDKMTGAEPTVERQELGERLLGIIGGHRMGTALNAQDLYMTTAPLPPDGVRVAGDERRIPRPETPTATQPTLVLEDSGARSNDTVLGLRELADLHERGALTDEEFASAKARLLA